MNNGFCSSDTEKRRLQAEADEKRRNLEYEEKANFIIQSLDEFEPDWMKIIDASPDIMEVMHLYGILTVLDRAINDEKIPLELKEKMRELI